MGYLDDVPEDKTFLLGDTRLHNLKELQESIAAMNDSEYGKFAGHDFNYFADWVQYVVGHTALADSLRASLDRDDANRILEEALENEVDEKPVIIEQKVEFAPPPEDEPVKAAEPKKNSDKSVVSVSSEEPDRIEDVESLMKKIAKNENEIKDILWKHFAWDLAKEFMYGMAVGILLGFVLSRILLR